MKFLLGQTENWRFPIMSEETWAGVEENKTSTTLSSNTHHFRRHDHDPSTKQFQSSTPVQPYQGLCSTAVCTTMQ
ncbi:MAG: hypothetical protein ACI8XC_004657, partial [Gammaproteobacteria bacterium]